MHEDHCDTGLVMPVGFEPTTSSLRGWRLNQFVDGTIEKVVGRVGLEPTELLST